MKNEHNEGHYRILLSGFIAGIFVAMAFLMISYKFSPFKRTKPDSAENLIAPYEVQNTIKPEDLQTPNKIYTVIKSQDYKIPILTYHYVEIVQNPKDTMRQKLDIQPYVLDKELQALTDAHYQLIFMKDVPKILSGEIPYSSKSAALTFDDGYEDFYTDVFPLLKKYQAKATIFLIYDFIGRKGFMTQKEIQEVSDSHLVEIGAHTLDHLYLKLLPKNTVEEQVRDSKNGLENLFKTKVVSFAYPYGAFNQNTIDIVRSAGLTSAVSEIPGMIQSEVNVFYLSRIRAGNFSYGNIIKFLENYKI